MYKRVLLKLSGEVLSGEGEKGFNHENIIYLVDELKKILEYGTNVGIVIGAGNLFRGREMQELSPTIADQIGMLGTVINALYLKDIFEKNNLRTVVVSQVSSLPSIRPIHYDDINLYFDAGYLVIFAGGTSNPFFTTDTAAALRAVEMKADILIKGTKVDGIYDKDPKKFTDARKFDTLTYDEAIDKGLKIMDTEAFSICKRYDMKILVMDFFKESNLLSAVREENVGTLVVPK
ncbi:uridylate kinase [Thermosipho melanesiensis]|uniref:Uridylate kinase n=2 Tax=Thermosipho melanesiensis TaxID=46541 RepID=PYRH_THEM4|nr:UMP kinase [Thermosipho melanesiensis]A6LK98.1 RecName: Full=Uridylate kinase; Short=UK; AltName: Full=Uridine monophosphate kinase; Short=UMP kinase; Short=UMPK [Thermosipho melanesiensis BI429]ABR30349.1 uridylate kinase [Thermosipho melanesiensis BI429]APT73515.1 uridylate kinase [Thermosipho melanesiensis]OOC37465.1 uridylate kinase [Thermosipho melanesiensis]OOC39670.1 uridylate kinase [Thermosipho melanesiensis]OOC39698.1 uridylate kinase [Thermosipho melanesiensis]